MNDSYSYYSDFTAGRFAADEYFQRWVLTGDEESDQFWQTFQNLYPGQAGNLTEARQLVLELRYTAAKAEPLSEQEKALIKQQIFDALELSDAKPVKTRSILFRNSILWRAAAMVGIILAAVLFYNREPGVPQLQAKRFSTGSGESKELMLPDSTVVILSAASSIEYPSDYMERPGREVFLQGNAFFKVTHDPHHKQFVVHAGSLAVTVLGTQFNVNARSAATEVGLVNGKVKVTSDKAETAYMLPGDKVRLDSLHHSLLKLTFDTSLYAVWTERTWKFRQTTLEDVVELMSKYYGIRAEFRNARAKDLRITAVIPVESLQMLTEVLEKTLHVRIDQSNDRLLIL